jgi:hypothetical protein
MFRYLYRWGDKLEDRVRGSLSHRPISYAFIGGFGVVVFWRGAWNTVDLIMHYFFAPATLRDMPLPWWDGPLSLALGTGITLVTGLFVSNFIGNEIIISGLRGQKKLVEKTESEIVSEVETIEEIHTDVHTIAAHVGHIEKNFIDNKQKKLT